MIKLFILLLASGCFVSAFGQEEPNLIHFRSQSYLINETSGSVVATAYRSGDTNITLSVDYLLEAESAIASQDFTDGSGTVVFAAGEIEKTITVQVIDDDETELSEGFHIILSNVVGDGELFGDGFATVAIEDNDSPAGLDGTFARQAESFEPYRSVTNVFDIDIGADANLFIAGEGRVQIKKVSLTGEGLLDYKFFPTEIIRTIEVDEVGNIFVGKELSSDRSVAHVRGTGMWRENYSARAGLNGEVATSQLLPENKMLFGGSIRVGTNDFFTGTYKLHANGEVDETFNRSAFNNSFVSAMAWSGSDFYAALRRTNEAGEVSFFIHRFSGNGLPDESFGEVHLDGTVHELLLQKNQYLLAVGEFETAAGTPLFGIARFRSNGSIDPSFIPVQVDGAIRAVALQSDGRIVIGGDFNQVNGMTRRGMARFEPDGTVDPSFDIGTGPNGRVQAIAVHYDGSIFVGGDFSSFSGQSAKGIVRLKGDVVSGKSFVFWERKSFIGHETTGSGEVSLLRAGNTNQSLEVTISVTDQTTSGIHDFQIETLNVVFEPGETRKTIPVAVVEDKSKEGREKAMLSLQASAESVLVTRSEATLIVEDQQTAGTRDATFRFSGGNRIVYSLQNAPEGQFLGTFWDSWSKVVRFNRDGTRDETYFDALEQWPSEMTHGLVQLAPLEDGRTYVWGNFKANTGPTTTNYIARLNADGTQDSTFRSPITRIPFDYGLTAVEALPTGEVIIGIDYDIIIYGAFRPSKIAVLAENGYLQRIYSTPASLRFTEVSDFLVVPDGRLFAGIRHWRSGIPALWELSPEGTIITNFTPELTGSINQLATAETYILAGGEMNNTETGKPVTLVKISMVDGSIDSAFNVPTDGSIQVIAVQADNKIIITGDFTEVHGVRREGIARLHSDGTLDESFQPGAGFDDVPVVLPLSDGSIFAGGYFFSYDLEPVRGLIKILGSDEPLALEIETFEGGIVVRAPALPGATYSLEESDNLIEWNPAGEATGIEGKVNFQISEANQPAKFYRVVQTTLVN